MPPGALAAWRGEPQKKNRRWIPWLAGGLVVAVALAAGLILLLHKGPPLGVLAATVQVTSDQPTACNGTADITGTVTTDGHAGRLEYQWIRNGKPPQSGLPIDVKAGQTKVTIPYHITFKGDGSTENVTLSVLKPRAVAFTIPVRYAGC